MALSPNKDIGLEDERCQHWVGFLEVTAFVSAHAPLVADWTQSL